MKVYMAGDSGPSGFGVATRYFVRHLLEKEDIEITFKTHFWGLNKKGFKFKTGGFPDLRFREYLLRNNIINKDYLIDEPREVAKREDVNLTKNLEDNRAVKEDECMIRQFDGKEDVWIALGGANFAEQAPQDEEIYTIVSTDYNLDIVPEKWEDYLEKVDEFWVPSKWVKNAVEERFRNARPDLVEKVKVMPYGVPMNYEPTEYDCEMCPNTHSSRRPERDNCLRDGKTNFLVISRFYHIKGVYRTIKAFIEEFNGRENVRLFFKTTSNQQFDFNPKKAAQSVIDELGYPDPPEIGMRIKPLDTQNLYDLLGHCDAFIQASRAECFGIAQFQAAYCKTPVIYTNWSAQKELIDEENDGFIPVNTFDLDRPKQESPSFMFSGSENYPPDSNWAVPDIEELRDKMRKVHEMSDAEREKRGKAARNFVEENYKWESQIKKRIQRLSEVS